MGGVALVRKVKMNWMIWTALSVFVLIVVVLTAGYWYKATTSATVINNTSVTLSVSDCEDYLVTLSPSQSQSVEPYVNASDGCAVFKGSSNLGTPAGCLIFPSIDGHVIGGSRVKLSTMFPYSAKRCSI